MCGCLEFGDREEAILESSLVECTRQRENNLSSSTVCRVQNCCVTLRSEPWSVLFPLPCGPSHSAASRRSHMRQLALNSHIEFLTASIKNVAASLVPVYKLSASLRTDTLLYRKYTPIPSQNRHFPRRLPALALPLKSHVLSLIFWNAL